MTVEAQSTSKDEKSGAKQTTNTFHGLCAAVAYGSSSVGMAFLNKAILSTYSFKYEFFIMASQLLLTFVLLEVMRLSGQLSFERYKLSSGLTFIGPSVAYGLNSILALSALSGMNIPMYAMVKRCAPFATLVLGTCLLQKGLPSAKVTAGVLFITLGCIVAGFGDLAFDSRAYLCGAASVILQAIYLVLLQRISQGRMATSETLYLNSANMFPVMLISSVAVGEFFPAMHAFLSSTLSFKLLFMAVIAMGCLLNYLLFLCTNLNCALTTTVVGTLKSVLQTFIGIFTFGGIDLNIFTVSGMIMNFLGGFLYSFSKYQQYRNGNQDKKVTNPSKS